MEFDIPEDQPTWDHAQHAQEVLLEFQAHMEDQQADFRLSETPEQSTEWPFGEYPQVEAVQEMYRPEPKQMPIICFQCGKNMRYLFFVT